MRRSLRLELILFKTLCAVQFVWDACFIICFQILMMSFQFCFIPLSPFLVLYEISALLRCIIFYVLLGSVFDLCEVFE